MTPRRLAPFVAGVAIAGGSFTPMERGDWSGVAWWFAANLAAIAFGYVLHATREISPEFEDDFAPDGLTVAEARGQLTSLVFTLSGHGAEPLDAILRRAGELRELAKQLESRGYGAECWQLVADELLNIGRELQYAMDRPPDAGDTSGGAP